MFKPGFYKISKMLQFGENGKCYVDAAEFLEKLKNEDPDEYRHEAKTLGMGLLVAEDGSTKNTMDIPEGVTEEEIQKEVEENGLVIENGKIILEEGKTKVENGELYMYDESKFLTGEEWVKVSTDVEDELNFIMYIYKLVE